MALSRSRFRTTFAVFRVPLFGPTLLAIFLAMLAEAVAFSYMALLAVEKIGMSPLELGVFLSSSALAGIVATTIFAHLHDRKLARWPLTVSMMAKAVGFGLCAVISETWMLLVNAAVLLGISAASYPLLFAAGKLALDGSDEKTISSGMAALRMGNSLSWAVGPALGAAMVAWYSLSTVYLGAALLAAMALIIVLGTRIKVMPQLSPPAPITLPVSLSTVPIVIALTAFHTAMFGGANVTSIVVAQHLGTQADVGVLSSLCALIELGAMGIFLLRPAGNQNIGLLLAGFAIFTGYFILPSLWLTLPTLYIGQLFRAGGIAIISIAGMAYLQKLLPGRVGVAAALFGNTASAGLLISGLGTGLWAQSFGYESLFSACGVLCLFGMLALSVAGVANNWARTLSS